MSSTRSMLSTALAGTVAIALTVTLCDAGAGATTGPDRTGRAVTKATEAQTSARYHAAERAASAAKSLAGTAHRDALAAAIRYHAAEHALVVARQHLGAVRHRVDVVQQQSTVAHSSRAATAVETAASAAGRARADVITKSAAARTAARKLQAATAEDRRASADATSKARTARVAAQAATTPSTAVVKGRKNRVPKAQRPKRIGAVTPASGPFNCTTGVNVDSAKSLTTYQLPPVQSQKVASTTVLGPTFAGIALQQQIATSGNRQYVAYYDGARRLTVGYRTVPDGSWSVQAVGGDDAVAGWDSHDSIAIGIDAAGNLHLAANMHAVALRYWRTTTPGDLTTLTRVPVMVDPVRESSVSYPQFLTTADGTLTFNYRQGYAGRADNYFYAYDVASKSWHSLNSVPVFDGEGLRSAYYQITRGTGGWFYLSYVWRRPGGVEFNSRLSLVRTADFVHYQTVSGAAVSLPLKYGTAGVMVDDVPENGGLFNNQEKVGVDGTGQVTVSYGKYDAAGTEQLNVARFAPGAGWDTQTVTNWTGRWTISGINTLSVDVVYNAPSALPDGRTAVTFWCGGTRDTVVLDTATLTPVAERPFKSNLPYVYWSPVLDYSGSFTNFAYDVDNPETATDYYTLKWGSLGSNGDQPRSAYPAPGPLTVYHVVR